jgi:hypothetical protein
MRLSLRSGLLSLVVFGAGWLAGQSGAWRAYAQKQEDGNTPTSLDGFEIPVRRGPGEVHDLRRKYSIEVYRDNRRGNLVYVSETGSIAVVPEAKK